MMEDNYYVDDLVLGSSSVEEGFAMRKEAEALMGEAKMHLRKWCTNSKKLRKLWLESEGEQSVPDVGSSQGVVKVLGVPWNIDTDHLTFSVSSIIQFAAKEENTKRTILKTSARIFDPFGFFNPFVIRAKCLLQEIWRSKIDWEEALPQNLENKWIQWKSELPRMDNFQIPRRYFVEPMEEIPLQSLQLHAFSDASAKAYGCVIYLRQEMTSGTVCCSFVASKCRVSPVKTVTLPRLELLGALTGARLLSYVRGSLKWQEVKSFQWVDSTIVLNWVSREASTLDTFVCNRVKELHRLSSSTIWMFCPGQDNVADKLTRGLSVGKLLEDARWWQGPEWLSEVDTAWPDQGFTPAAGIQEELETTVTHISIPAVKFPLEVEYYSSLHRLIRVVAWIRRFLGNVKGQPEVGYLSSSKIYNSEILCMRMVQEEVFPDEITKLRKNVNVHRTSKLMQLAPFLDKEGLIRVGGRLLFSDFSGDAQHPIVLPPGHPFTVLWILSCHKKLLHAGVRDTLLELRERVWVLRARQSVKRVLRTCFVCRRSQAKTGKQIEAPLPKERVTRSTPFQSVGIDFAGPLHVQGLEGRNGTEKVFIALFTCMATRAIHLELVTRISTAHFLLALRRFVSRRGLCATIFSDNALCFKRAEKDLHKLWKLLGSQEVLAFYGQKGIKWKFIAERAAWWGKDGPDG